MTLYIKKLSANAKTPTDHGDLNNAGYDLYAAEAAVIPPLTRKLIKTNIAIQLPEKTYGRIAPRSGLAYKSGIDVMAGVIDRNYRDDVGVILFNTGTEDFIVKIGDRIAQLIVETYHKPQFAEFDELPQLADSKRAGGFGSTGI